MKLLALTPPANIYFAKERVLDEELISGRAEFLFFNSFVEAACGAFIYSPAVPGRCLRACRGCLAQRLPSVVGRPSLPASLGTWLGL